jgi:hypothetical protein
MNNGYPIWLPAAKCLKTLAGGDPNGAADSLQFQRLAASNVPISGCSILSRRSELSNLAENTEANLRSPKGEG